MSKPPVIKKEEKSLAGSGLVKDLFAIQEKQLLKREEEQNYLKEKAAEKDKDCKIKETLDEEENVDKNKNEEIEGDQHEEDNKNLHKTFARGR